MVLMVGGGGRRDPPAAPTAGVLARLKDAPALRSLELCLGGNSLGDLGCAALAGLTVAWPGVLAVQTEMSGTNDKPVVEYTRGMGYEIYNTIQ